MVWQDIVITVTLIVFSYALLPQIYQGFKHKKGFVNLQTSAITALGTYVLGFVYFTLKLYFSAFMVFIIGTLWAILFFQKITYKK